MSSLSKISDLKSAEIDAICNLPEKSSIVRIPDALYADFKTIAINEWDTEISKLKIFLKLKQWVNEKFKDHGILATVDFSIRDWLPDVRDHLGNALKPGMYVLLLEESETSLITPNEIENGTENQEDSF